MIHPTAVVDPKARLGRGVTVGPYSIIGPGVEVGEETSIGAHVVLEGPMRIGRKNRIFAFASLGGQPQDKKYAGEDTSVEIGDGNTIREYVTINRGTVQDIGVTRLGNDNWLMAYTHLAHDCQVGSHTIFANCAQLAGHVVVGDWVILGGFTTIQQRVRIGAHAFSGMQSSVTLDVPPFVKIGGNPTRPFGINAEGLKRRGFSPDEIEGLKKAYRTLYRSSLGLDEAKRELEAQAARCAPVRALTDFLAQSTAGIIR